MPLPSYIRVGDIRRQLAEQGHDCSEADVEKLLLELGFADTPPVPPVERSSAAPVQARAAAVARPSAPDADAELDAMQVAYQPYPAGSALQCSRERLPTTEARSVAEAPAFTIGDASSDQGAAGFEWHGVSSARPGLGRLLSAADPSAAPSYAQPLRSTGGGAGPRPWGPSAASGRPAGSAQQPARTAGALPPTGARSSRVQRSAQEPAAGLHELYQSLYSAATGLGGSTTLASGSTGAATAKGGSAHWGSPRDVAAASAHSSRRTTLEGAARSAPSSRRTTLDEGSTRAAGGRRTEDSEPATGGRRASASGTERPGGAPSRASGAAAKPPKRSDPVSRFHELQRLWSRDRFLRAGGDGRAQRRQKEGFKQVFSALHAAEEAARRRG